MITAVAGSEFQASQSGFPTGLNTVGVQLLDPVGNVITARTTLGVLEVPVGSGNYLATLLAPPTVGNYLVFWDQGIVSPTTTGAETVVVTPGVAAVIDPRLLWLRRMVDDMAITEADLLTAPGGINEFFVSNPPISATPSVTIAGQSAVTPGDFTWTTFSVILTVQPPAGQIVTIRYARTTFADVELESYITAAMEEYVADRHVVYKAAIYAIDTLLTGFGAALDFGAGQENFQLSSVFNRLLQLRNTWETWLERNAENGMLVSEIIFDAQDPVFPGSYDPNQIDYGSDTVTGSPPGYPRAIDP